MDCEEELLNINYLKFSSFNILIQIFQKSKFKVKQFKRPQIEMVKVDQLQFLIVRYSNLFNFNSKVSKVKRLLFQS